MQQLHAVWKLRDLCDAAIKKLCAEIALVILLTASESEQLAELGFAWRLREFPLADRAD
jgi:hypothetical protein